MRAPSVALLLLTPALAGLLPAFGQETPPPRLSLDLSAGLNRSSNPDLSASGGSETRARLDFGLNLASDTPDQTFRLRLSGLAESGSGLGTPTLRLSYGRTGKNADLALDASYSDSPVDLTEIGGTLDAPALLATTGRLRAAEAGLELHLGKEGPWGLDLSARTRSRDYTDTTDPDVQDSTRESLSAGLQLRQLAGGDLGLTYNQDRESLEDAVRTRRESRSVTLSFTRALDAATRATVRLGNTEAETRKSGAVSAASSGLTAGLDLARDLGNGTVELGLGLDRDAVGARQSLRLARSLTLPSGSFSAEIGWTGRDGEAGTATGRLGWSQTLPSDTFSVALARQVALNASDADTVQTSAQAAWSHALSERSKLGLSYGLSAVAAAGDTPVEGVTRQSLAASWSLELARDWALNTGVTLSSLDRDTTGRAEDATVFVTLGRSFVLLP